jgi:threonine/homoserine efflux transporter RhtA
LTPRLGPWVIMTLRVAVGRLIFFKLSLPRYGVVRCPAPCYSLHMRIHS